MMTFSYITDQCSCSFVFGVKMCIFLKKSCSKNTVKRFFPTQSTALFFSNALFRKWVFIGIMFFNYSGLLFLVSMTQCLSSLRCMCMSASRSSLGTLVHHARYRVSSCIGKQQQCAQPSTKVLITPPTQTHATKRTGPCPRCPANAHLLDYTVLFWSKT